MSSSERITASREPTRTSIRRRTTKTRDDSCCIGRLLAEGTDAPLFPGIEDIVDGGLSRMLAATAAEGICAKNAEALRTFEWNCPYGHEGGVDCGVVIDPAKRGGRAKCGGWCSYITGGSGPLFWLKASALPVGRVYASPV